MWLTRHEADAYSIRLQSRDLGSVGRHEPRGCPKYQAGVEPVADVKSKLQQDITSRPDDAPLLGPIASEAARCLAAIAMTAVATIRGAGGHRGR
jgi:hypothetical protein